MKIIQTKSFKQELRAIALRIKSDKPSAAVRFVRLLQEQIRTLTDSPYRCRQSIYFDDPKLRDMIFKGYTIIYEIQTELIIVHTIFNRNQPPKTS
jgi:plasmid stabilization system protein ParE